MRWQARRQSSWCRSIFFCVCGTYRNIFFLLLFFVLLLSLQSLPSCFLLLVVVLLCFFISSSPFSCTFHKSPHKNCNITFCDLQKQKTAANCQMASRSVFYRKSKNNIFQTINDHTNTVPPSLSLGSIPYVTVHCTTSFKGALVKIKRFLARVSTYTNRASPIREQILYHILQKCTLKGALLKQ